MLFPLEVFYRGDIRELAQLVGLNQWINETDVYKRVAMIKYKRLYVMHCKIFNEYRDCVYKYTNNNSKYFIKFPILAVMRGSVARFYEGGDVKQVAFPFAKFFNWKENSISSKIPSTKWVITEKLDGSLVVVWRDPDTGELRANTRGTLDSPIIEAFWDSVKRMELREHLEGLVKENTTWMFEFVNPEYPASMVFRNIVEIIKEQPHKFTPYLLAYRDHSTMEIEYNVDTDFPRPRFYNINTVDDIMHRVKEMTDKEGLVVHFPGHLYDTRFKWWNYILKIKSKSYVIKAYIGLGENDPGFRRTAYRKIALAIVNNHYEDLIPILQGTEYGDFIQKYLETYSKLVDTWIVFREKIEAKAREHGINWIKEYLSKSLNAATEASALDYDAVKSIKWIVRNKLIHKDSPRALVRALERYRNRLEKLIEKLEKIDKK